MIRFMHFFKYAEGVSVDDGETWYLGEHAPQVKKLPGVLRYHSWRQLEVPQGATAAEPSAFVRRSELCFDNFEAWQKANKTNPALWLPSRQGIPGFGEFECMFLDEEPEYDLLRDAPPQHYKYIALPLTWPKGVPEVEDTDDLIVNSYFLNYRSDISIADGEDWYLGHHTREGKQLPGMKHYKTWKTIRVPEDPDSPLQPNKWFRLTELGLPSFDAYRANMGGGETRIRFTPSPLGRVFEGLHSVFIRLNQPDDLLT